MKWACMMQQSCEFDKFRKGMTAVGLKATSLSNMSRRRFCGLAAIADSAGFALMSRDGYVFFRGSHMTTNSRYRRGQIVETTPRWHPYRLGRVLATDGDKLLVEEALEWGLGPCWWRADTWRPLPRLGDQFLGAKYDG